MGLNPESAAYRRINDLNTIGGASCSTLGFPSDARARLQHMLRQSEDIQPGAGYLSGHPATPTPVRPAPGMLAGPSPAEGRRQ